MFKQSKIQRRYSKQSFNSSSTVHQSPNSGTDIKTILYNEAFFLYPGTITVNQIISDSFLSTRQINQVSLLIWICEKGGEGETKGRESTATSAGHMAVCAVMLK